MANVIGQGKYATLIDEGGDPVTVTDSRLDVNAAITIASDTIDIGDVEIKGHTGIGHGSNLTISNSTSEQLVVSSTPCKHVDIQAATGNVGYIAVGDDGVDEGINTGIRLNPGDIYSIDIDNLNKIYLLSEFDGENVTYTYFT
tara:strand:- start:1440 stop:1868 length:429 start_codon:yes stop_codon:yes gene_type:complete